MAELVFIVPGRPDQRTGGYLYDAHITQALRDQGVAVEVVGLPGAFPLPDALAKQSLFDALTQAPARATVVVDGLALGGLGDVVERARAARAQPCRVVALVHHPLADERGLEAADQRWLWQQERRALRACDRVIVTSAFTAQRLIEQDYLTTAPSVVCPGVAPAPLAAAAHDVTPRSECWLCVASLTPRKGHEVLLRALDRLRDRSWVSPWVGDAGRDPAHANTLKASIERLGLGERIPWLGELDDAALAARYHQASLCVLPSYYEGFGMVVTEAVARGLPVITTDGGALPQTLPDGAGLVVPAGDAAALAEALRQWLDDRALRQRLMRGALEARSGLASWAKAGERFIDALGLSTLDPKAREL